MTDTGLFFNLLVLAVVPALCEELLFRGYAQRQAERALGAAGGLVLAGVVFGLYHLRLSQVVPLSILGIYLGYITWRTGSLWPAVAVHFLNNAFAVAVGAYVARQPDVEPGDLDSVQFPWYFLLAGLLVFVLVVRAMEQQAGRLLSGPTAPGSPPVP
jgi:membrane protease YdiL (CAAX protease family)